MYHTYATNVYDSTLLLFFLMSSQKNIPASHAGAQMTNLCLARCVISDFADV